MKIWQIKAADGGDWVTYFEPTRKSADAKAAELKRDGLKEITIEPEIVDISRVGIARKLQNMIDRYCLNEH